MIKGQIATHAAGEDPALFLLEDLLLGESRDSPIVFQPDEGDAEFLQLSKGNAAFKCESCGRFIIITGPDAEYTDTECLECRTPMPAGITSCPKCGWTYKEDLDASAVDTVQ